MKKGKVLAIDYGTKRIGLASGDLEHKIAFPRDIIENKGNIVSKITSLCGDLGVVVVVIGFPLSMKKGQRTNPLLNDVGKFAAALKDSGLKVEFIDERLSSFEAGEKIARTRAVDAHAAQIVLQRYFDSL